MLHSILLHNLVPFLLTIFLSLIAIKTLYPNLRRFIKKPEGPQTVHQDNVPRFGGLVIFLTFILMSIINFFFSDQDKYLIILLLIVLTPVFILGFSEDITQEVSPRLRLFGSLVSAVLLLLIFNLFIMKVDIHFIDTVLQYHYISFLFTLLCIVFLIQSFNVIDGLNGLSLSTGIISLSTFCFIAFNFQDFINFELSLLFISILFGVLIFNFPYGKIFIGDSGAYIVGLLLSISALFLINNNPSLSSFVILQALIYPAYELIRTFFRRLIARKNVFKPDTGHLHSIFYKYFYNKFDKKTSLGNPIASIQIIALQILNSIYIMHFYKDKRLVILGIVVFIITYEFFYFLLKKSNERFK